MSGTDLVAKAAVSTDVVIHPGTGELVDANNLGDVARILQELEEFRQQIQDQERVAHQILAAAAKAQGKRTLEVAGRKVEVVSSGEKRDYAHADIDKLEQLVEKGLPADRVRELVYYEPRVNGRVARQLATANEEYAALIWDAIPVVPIPVKVKVTS